MKFNVLPAAPNWICMKCDILALHCKFDMYVKDEVTVN